MNSKENKTVFLLGDFNINYKQDTSTNKFFDSMSSHLFLPYILQQTRTRSNSKTLIDYIFSNVISSNFIPGIITLYLRSPTPILHSL